MKTTGTPYVFPRTRYFDDVHVPTGRHPSGPSPPPRHVLRVIRNVNQYCDARCLMTTMSECDARLGFGRRLSSASMVTPPPEPAAILQRVQGLLASVAEIKRSSEERETSADHQHVIVVLGAVIPYAHIVWQATPMQRAYVYEHMQSVGVLGCVEELLCIAAFGLLAVGLLRAIVVFSSMRPAGWDDRLAQGHKVWKDAILGVIIVLLARGVEPAWSTLQTMTGWTIAVALATVVLLFGGLLCLAQSSVMPTVP
jgi:hypothetical protein